MGSSFFQTVFRELNFLLGGPLNFTLKREKIQSKLEMTYKSAIQDIVETDCGHLWYHSVCPGISGFERFVSSSMLYPFSMPIIRS